MIYSGLRKKQGIIISGFAGIGKTGFRERVSFFDHITYYDLSSSYFRKDENWQKVYVDLAEALTEKYDYVFVSTHDVVIKELIARNDNFYIVYPKSYCKDEYRYRFMKRGNSQEYIDRFMKSWDKFIEQIDNVDYPKKISLRTGQYLSDVITRMR